MLIQRLIRRESFRNDMAHLLNDVARQIKLSDRTKDIMHNTLELLNNRQSEKYTMSFSINIIVDNIINYPCVEFLFDKLEKSILEIDKNSAVVCLNVRKKDILAEYIEQELAIIIKDNDRFPGAEEEHQEVIKNLDYKDRAIIADKLIEDVKVNDEVNNLIWNELYDYADYKYEFLQENNI